MTQSEQSPDYISQIEELLDTAAALDAGPSKIAVLEQAVRIADANADEHAGYVVREQLIKAATFGGSPEVAMVAFAWCLAKYDRNPEGIETHGLLWKYKWVIDAAAEYPQISREQIENMLRDMERRYEAYGSGMHPVYQTMREVNRLMGDFATAEQAHARVIRCTPDALSNCAACEQHALIRFFFDTNKPDDAFEAAKPIVNGRMHCAEVPHTTYSYLLLPLFHQGQLGKATQYHNLGLRLLGTNPKFVPQFARHIVFLTITDNLGAALKLFEKHWTNAEAATCPAWRFDFYRAGAFLFDRLAESQATYAVRVPANVKLPPEVSNKNPASLCNYFTKEAKPIAHSFDSRNGNNQYAQQLAELAELKKLVTPHKV